MLTFHADHGPESEVLVEYMLSFEFHPGDHQSIYENCMMAARIERTSELGCEHEVNTFRRLDHGGRFILFGPCVHIRFNREIICRQLVDTESIGSLDSS